MRAIGRARSSWRRSGASAREPLRRPARRARSRRLLALDGRTRRLIGLVEHHKRRVLREAAVARPGTTAAAYAGNSEPIGRGDLVGPRRRSRS
jgi:hypothetical protein